jgi:Predicted acetyltransferase
MNNIEENNTNNREKLGISLELVQTKHDDLLLKIFKESRQDFAWINGISEEQKETIIFQQFIAEREQLKFVYPEAELNVVILDKKPIGRLYIYYGKNEDRILEIGLLEDYRDRGIGTTIVTKVIEKAIEKGKVVSLQVAWFNHAAYRFYEQLGFQVVENKGIAYEMKYIP